jgi:hypothetical protein
MYKVFIGALMSQQVQTLYGFNLLAILISYGTLFFSYNKTVSTILSAAKIISRTTAAAVWKGQCKNKLNLL